MGASPSLLPADIPAYRTGRPKGSNGFSPELGASICARIALGETLHAICDPDDFPVAESTVRSWVVQDINPAFSASYARARLVALDAHVDRMVEIAQTEPDNQRARNVLDTMKWIASKLRPEKYGDRLELTGNLNVTVSVADTLRAREARAGIVDVVPVQAALESPKSATTYPDPSGE